MIHEFTALGTKWWITLFDETDAADVIFDDIGRFVSTYETRYSRFKPDSLISQLNRERKIEQPDKDFQDILRYGKQLFIRSNSTFNFLTGHILEARGYDANYSFKDNGSETLTAGNPVTDLLVSEETVELTHGNVDLGGFGKGYLIDLLAKRLQEEHTIEHFLINGGGDMYATSNKGELIEILLENPVVPGTAIGKTSLLDQGFAASSPHRRRWPKASGGDQTHIVGDIATDAIFVKAATAAEADAFATTCLLLNQREQEQLAQQENLGLAAVSTAEKVLSKNGIFDTEPLT